MKKTKQSFLSANNEKPTIIGQCADSYKSQFELREKAEVIETLRQRLASRGRNKRRTADDFFSEFFAKNNIPLEE